MNDLPTRKNITNAYTEAYPERVKFIQDARPYKMPKGFMPMMELAAIVAMMIDARRETYNDQATLLNALRTTLWFVQDAPIYLISTQLLRAFEASDVHDQDKLFANLEIPLPTFIVLLPQNAVKTPQNGIIDYFVVHASSVEKPEWSRGTAYGINVPYIQHEHPINLHWSAIDSRQTAWFSGMGLYLDGRVVQSDTQLGADIVTEADRIFLASMKSLVLQCFLTLAYAPQLLEEENASQGKGRLRKEKQKEAKYRNPRWLGKNYKNPQLLIAATGQIRKSPRGHWRQGHNRRVPVGPNRERREWRWIEPTFVGEEASGKIAD